MKGTPIGRRVTSVHRLGVIEAIVAHRNVLRMEVGDVAVSISEDRVVGAVCLQSGDLEERRKVRSPGAQIALLKRRDWPIHHGEADPTPTFGPYDRPAMSPPGVEVAAGQPPVHGPI